MFKKAKPIFLKGLSSEKNILAVFKANINYCGGGALFKMTGATFCRVIINGCFVHYGPARAPHNRARVDEIDITPYLNVGNNVLLVEVISYNVNSFYTLMHKGFLLAEVISGECVLCATGYDFIGFRDVSKIQKVMRYSYQRHLTEVYEITENNLIEIEVEEQNFNLQYLERGVPISDYDIKRPKYTIFNGIFKNDTAISPIKNRFIENISHELLGFYENEITQKPFYDYQQMIFSCEKKHTSPFREIEMSQNQYIVFDMTKNTVGFILSKIKAKCNSRLIISFDEYIDESFIDCKRFADNVINIIEYNLNEGTHCLETIECYGFRYIQISVLKGAIELLDMSVREYIFPKIAPFKLKIDNQKLIDIYNAAVETFRQNTLDVYMDCPTRERAGWLCDSYFTAQAEFAFTNQCRVEKEFMENFVFCASKKLPMGMLPMIYPGDIINGEYIPQWSMWYILELDGYLKRNKAADKQFFKELCYNLIKFFNQYKNEYGLLEKLPNWNFVEWSKANEWVYDVNFPTNMLFARMLEIIGVIYDDSGLINEAENIRQSIVALSFNGTMFIDNAVRKSENNRIRLESTGNISEACQYYAIVFKTINFNDEKYTKLKDMVLNNFGPHRQYDQTGYNIEPANALMGIYLRMELLLEYEYDEILLKEVESYFGNMAELTGTLWEHKEIRGSLNHGFASYVGVVIKKVIDRKEQG